jgi:hypothetical protein
LFGFGVRLQRSGELTARCVRVARSSGAQAEKPMFLLDPIDYKPPPAKQIVRPSCLAIFFFWSLVGCRL